MISSYQQIQEILVPRVPTNAPFRHLQHVRHLIKVKNQRENMHRLVFNLPDSIYVNDELNTTSSNISCCQNYLKLETSLCRWFATSSRPQVSELAAGIDTVNTG